MPHERNSKTHVFVSLYNVEVSTEDNLNHSSHNGASSTLRSFILTLMKTNKDHCVKVQESEMFLLLEIQMNFIQCVAQKKHKIGRNCESLLRVRREWFQDSECSLCFLPLGDATAYTPILLQEEASV